MKKGMKGASRLLDCGHSNDAIIFQLSEDASSEASTVTQHQGAAVFSGFLLIT